MAWNDFLKNYQMQGGTPLMMNYGINTLANKFNNYAGSNQRLDYDEGLSGWGSTMGNVPDAPRMPPMLDPTGQMGASNYRGPAPNTLDPNWQHQLELQKRPAYQAPEKTGINFPSIFGAVKGGLEFLGEKFKRPEAKQIAYDAIMGSRDDQG
jgi:hypothetical protein